MESTEKICQIVNGHNTTLWENGWIGSAALRNALEVSKIIVSMPETMPEVVSPKEVALFTKNAWTY
ncbi:hypothetical protein [Aliiroseovarius sp. PrR006]|uniref:hypothetical protein n=1 Tax=Aliiroseovarius sp. PrR006 TaxID=2706883 RepID=UPI0013D5A2F0|nr:hypothetical protein [Aliiroseovarius sp. PrR006]NDW52804.1 hypothetical protein [Aliiroseovarius sp. PrR006]